MKSIPMLMLLMTLQPLAAGAGPQAAETVEALRWEKRVILVFSPAPAADDAVIQLESLAAEIEDRHIAWFVIGDGRLRTNYPAPLGEAFESDLRARYFDPEPENYATVLIGKDGGVKSRRADLDLERLFGQIDQMPMRLQEMQNANQP